MEKDNTGDLGITIGMDVSDRFTEIFAIDERGEWIESGRMPTKQEALREGLSRYPRARVVLEVGCHSAWISRQLESEGFEVVTASSGEEGLELARTLKPSLITLDVLMPSMDGWSVLQEVKADPELDNIPVVMITSKTKDKDRKWGMEQGADDYITKPFEADALLDVINRFVHGRIGAES